MEKTKNYNVLKIIGLILFDLLTILVVAGVSCLIVGVPFYYLATSMNMLKWLLILTAVLLVGAFLLTGVYSSYLKYLGVKDAIKISITLFIVMSIIVILAGIIDGIPVRWAVCFSVISLPVILIFRFSFRAYNLYFGKEKKVERKQKAIIIGAGQAGSKLVEEIQSSNKINVTPVCILDDNDSKIGLNIHGVKVVGTSKDIQKFVSIYNADQIFIAIPSSNKKKLGELIKQCQKTGCKVKTLPSTHELISGEAMISAMKDVSVVDLLGREETKVNLKEIMTYIENQVVMVTGGGGSIGSELCRQIAKRNPKQLIILDIYENTTYEIAQELKRRCPDLNLEVLIASVRDQKRINDIFDKYRPNIIFHAAAHKHVPLMETSPNEAVKNNVGGTLNVAMAADKYGVKRMVLISTDKAVNPTNIMGATKRICEMIVQQMNKKSQTEFVAVRFGNVLGSNGSVIPLFKKQIAEGGPVTVTHKDITRFFMTIPEAVSLVLQAGAYAQGGEIFVLDMGKPVRIYDMAENLIRLSGYEPNVDIMIEVTGLRPGEKLYEELLMAEEGLKETANKRIHIGKPIELDEEKLFMNIDELLLEAYKETDKMKDLVKELVPTYVIDRRK
ncbi:MAG: polysaccharide biosynthesis protein [Clostridiales bacterium]|nr:polysaccharide biosynthesis protein [Clostridiales bacterium]